MLLWRKGREKYARYAICSSSSRFYYLFYRFFFLFSFSFLGVWGCSLLSPCLTRPEEEEEERKEKVNIDSLSLTSIGGFF